MEHFAAAALRQSAPEGSPGETAGRQRTPGCGWPVLPAHTPHRGRPRRLAEIAASDWSLVEPLSLRHRTADYVVCRAAASISGAVLRHAAGTRAVITSQPGGTAPPSPGADANDYDGETVEQRPGCDAAVRWMPRVMRR